jgi:hypothetical protein
VYNMLCANGSTVHICVHTYLLVCVELVVVAYLMFVTESEYHEELAQWFSSSFNSRYGPIRQDFEGV